MNHQSISSTEPNHFESLYPPDSRFDEIEKALSFIKTGNSCQVISLPGVGRADILGLLAYNRAARLLHLKENQKWFHFVMMNFSEIRGRNLADATKYIFLELKNSLEQREIEEFETVNKILQECLKSNDNFVFFQGLKKALDYLCLEKELTVVFLFDRFEEYIPSLTPQFFSNLRVFRDRAKYRFSVVFPVNKPLEESVGHEMLSSFYEFIEGNTIYLPLNDPKILNFRISYIEKVNNKKIDPKILEEIVKLTGGHAKLTRMSVEVVDPEPVEGQSNKALAEFLLSKQRVRQVLNEIWKAFSPYEQSLISNGKASESSYLVALGLVKENKLAVPLLETFALGQNYETEKIVFEETKNEIFKGQVAISHGLTRSEFKLLKFMILNPGKILGRDDVINAVWGELSSTAGVTEQALDQLIFRLRKKIEENPNFPTHIQTVKGRGFKFTP